MTRERGRLYAAPGSDARPFADGLAWLWRLGAVADEPNRGHVGLGVPADGARLSELVRGHRLRHAIVFAESDHGDRLDHPGSRAVDGIASFPCGSVRGRHIVFSEGSPILASGLGSHAVWDDGITYLGARPSDWGVVSTYWLFPLLADLLPRELERPLIVLPPLGCIRLDDVPGTAQQQLEARAHPDREMVRRIDRYARAYARSGAQLVVAIASMAIDQGDPVPLEAVWPRSVEALRRGVAKGAFEVACHGTLHLDREALAAGEVESREFARLTEGEAGERIDAASDWLRSTVGPPRSFIAPAWGYSGGALAAAAQRELPTWCPPAPGPLLQGWRLAETTKGSLRGLNGLDFRPLAALAAVGLPPTPVLHGRLLDHRGQTLGLPRDGLSLARLALRQDITRLPAVRGVRWVGASELVAALRLHDRTELGSDGAVVGPGLSRALAR